LKNHSISKIKCWWSSWSILKALALDLLIVIELAGGKFVAAIVTNDSIKSLGLKKGVKACALIKASQIMLAVNA
jgi:molybdopterin-binding protein